MQVPLEGLKLNIGCGHRRIEGWVGIDATAQDTVDLVADALTIPLPSACATEVMAIHLVEHLLPWDLPTAMAEWFRLMRPNGRLILELPDIVKVCRNIADDYRVGGKHPDQMGLWGAYGDIRTKDERMLHRYGYSFKTLRPIVAAAGFVGIVETETKFHPAGRATRDFRLEASKPVRTDA